MSDNTKSNNPPDPALIEAGEQLTRMRHASTPASADFRARLKEKILEERHKQFSMGKILNAFSSVLSIRYFVPAIAMVLIVAITATTIHYWPGQRPAALDQFSRMIINSAYAQDNFEVSPTESDSLGVSSETGFTVKSREKIDLAILKQGLHVEPAVEFDIKQVNDNEFKVTPKAPLVAKKVYKVQIAAAFIAENGLPEARDYSFAFQVKDEFKVLRTLPGNINTGVPLDAGIEITFSHDNYQNFDKYFTIEPSVDGKFEQHKRTIVFIPKKLSSSMIYTVTVKKELELKGSDKRLDKDFVFKFETVPSDEVLQKRSAQFDFMDNYNDFTTKGAPTFGVYAYNVNATELPGTLYNFPSVEKYLEPLRDHSRMPSWAQETRYGYTYNTNGLARVGDYQLAIQKSNNNQFVALPAALPAGYYVLEVKLGDWPRQVFFQVTDLAVYSKVTETDTVVWVNDINTKSPVQGASVQLMDNSIVKSTTDKTGVATFPTATAFNRGNEADGYAFDYYLMVKSGNQQSVVPMFVNFNTEQKFDLDNYWRYFFTDRSLYKPTDAINFWGFVKPRADAPIDRNLTVKLTKGQGYYYDYSNEPIVFAETNANLDANGFYTGILELDNVTPGYKQLEVYSGDNLLYTKSINIDRYTKPAYDISVKSKRVAVWAGDKASFDMQANFFEGTPVSGLGMIATFLGENAVKTNDEGTASLIKDVPYTDCVDWSNCSRYPTTESMYVTPQKAEDGDIYGDSYVRVFGANIEPHVQIKRESRSDSAVASVLVNKIYLDKLNQADDSFADYSDGPAVSASVTVKITEITYNKVEDGEYYDFINKTVQKSYHYERVEKQLASVDGITDTDGAYNLPFKVLPDRSYRAEARVVDNHGRHNFDVSWYYTPLEYVNVGMNSFYELNFDTTIDAEKTTKEFSSGEDMKVVFTKNKEVLPARPNGFMYLLLQKGLQSEQVVGEANYSAKFEDAYSPNVYIQSVYFDGTRYYDTSNVWWGATGPVARLKLADRKLNLNVSADKTSYRPGEKAKLSVDVTDANGQPVSGTVNMSLVDEAFYKISGQYVDPLGELYVNIRSGEIASFSSHRVPVSGMGAEKGGCFVAGTKVRLANGLEKSIESVNIGDEILTFANEKTLQKVAAKVVEKYEHTVDWYLLVNGKLKVTPEHRMFINRGWQTIGTAVVGDYLTDENGQAVKIVSIEKVSQRVKVYNFQVADYHTYFAGGFYAHNDKGGARSNFLDVALFQSVNTDANGRASFELTLPDNLTSWRATAQVISGDNIMAGTTDYKILVKLPIFVEATASDEYLAADKPQVKMRAYGEALKSGDAVKFNYAIPSLNVTASSVAGEAFKPSYLNLPALTVGQHEARFGVENAAGKDALIKKITVLGSRLVENKQSFYEVTAGLKPTGSATGRTELVFSDHNQGRYYGDLLSLTWSGGDRVDQKLARVVSNDLLKKYFNEKNQFPESFDATVYQLPDNGGIALLPYADAEVELSAKIAAVAPERFDRAMLAKYFDCIIADSNSNQLEVAYSLYGLASLDEPVLLQVRNFAAVTELKADEKLVIGLATLKMGDESLARKIYSEVLNDSAEKMDPYIRLKVGKDNDDMLTATALAAELGAGLNAPEHEALWKYVQERGNKDVLTKLEELQYLANVLPKQIPGEASFTVVVGGKSVTKKLGKWETYSLSLTPEQLASIEFKDVMGKVGLVSSYETPLAFGAVESNLNLNLGPESIYAEVKNLGAGAAVSREYFVDGKKTNKFNESDLVEIRIYPVINKNSLSGSYQITDYLPSGLRLVTSPYVRGAQLSNNAWWPFSVDGQVVKFSLTRDWNQYNSQKYFSYYARVSNSGEYLAEPTSIQSLQSSLIKNYGTPTTVIIGK